MKREAPFKTEADLCAAFIAWAKPQGWVAYAETCDWDILLVHADGTQIGVQAKLSLNMKALYQAIELGWYNYCEVGPDFRAVLTSSGGNGLILRALGLAEFYPSGYSKDDFNPGIGLDWRGMHYWNPQRRHTLPAYVPDVVAGASAPVQLTKWKIAALKIVAALELRGFVTRDDFKREGVDMRRWVGPQGWLTAGMAPGQFVKSPLLSFHTQHQTVYPQIKAELEIEFAAGRL